MRRPQCGFTLLEIAIVLVILGLLLGGLVKGQELISSARVHNLIALQDGIKAAYFGFEDRYRALPGDYASAVQNIPSVGGGGNGNGRIELGGTPLENLLVWDHLSHAGFLNYGFSASGATSYSASTSPTNAYGAYIDILFDNAYADLVAPPTRHSIKTGNQLPVEMVAEMDRKIDDGNAATGGFRGSAAYGGGGLNSCWNGSGRWLIDNAFPNCGAANFL
jgi:prepilin-type N-terminal cleavage/methylation domain-containing protein